MTVRAPLSPVLITGCSSGIGRATAERLARRKDRVVFATARRPEAVADLEAAGCRILPLDVADESSILAAVERIEAEFGAVEALVNNAGYSQSGAFEEVPIEAVRAQFETNVFGLVRLTQAVLPGMRRAGRGRILNIGSMGGSLTFPGGGYYHATKYALEALSDALRFEVAGFGIDVVLIRPGLIRANFDRAAVERVPPPASDSPYREFTAEVARLTRSAYVEGSLAKLGGDPDDAARVIENALDAARPKPRYRVTASAHVMTALRRLLGDRLWDRFLALHYPRPGR